MGCKCTVGYARYSTEAGPDEIRTGHPSEDPDGTGSVRRDADAETREGRSRTKESLHNEEALRGARLH